MNYLDFRKQFFDLGCFNIHQVYAWRNNFDKNNLTRWTKQSLLLRLRQGFYTFPEYTMQPNFSFFISNTIYKPSYLSLHSALAFYGIIPEAVTQITAVSSLKTAAFENAFGSFSYMRMKPGTIFGYDILPLGDRSIHIAQPEKAILDLLYLYPFYNTVTEIENLRFDEDFVRNNLDIGKLVLYLDRFDNKELTKRVNLFTDLYDL
jgi:predicted transcriptional regulator of viral defense system